MTPLFPHTRRSGTLLVSCFAAASAHKAAIAGHTTRGATDADLQLHMGRFRNMRGCGALNPTGELFWPAGAHRHPHKHTHTTVCVRTHAHTRQSPGSSARRGGMGAARHPLDARPAARAAAWRCQRRTGSGAGGRRHILEPRAGRHHVVRYDDARLFGLSSATIASCATRHPSGAAAACARLVPGTKARNVAQWATWCGNS